MSDERQKPDFFFFAFMSVEKGNYSLESGVEFISLVRPVRLYTKRRRSKVGDSFFYLGGGDNYSLASGVEMHIHSSVQPD